MDQSPFFTILLVLATSAQVCCGTNPSAGNSAATLKDGEQASRTGPALSDIEELFAKLGGLHLLDAPRGACGATTTVYEMSITYDGHSFVAVRQPTPVFDAFMEVNRLACVRSGGDQILVTACGKRERDGHSVCWAPSSGNAGEAILGQISIKGEIDAIFQHKIDDTYLLYISARDEQGVYDFIAVNIGVSPWQYRHLTESQFKALAEEIDKSELTIPWLAKVEGLPCPVDIRTADAPPAAERSTRKIIRLGGQGCPPGPSQPLQSTFDRPVCSVASCNLKGHGIIYFAGQN